MKFILSTFIMSWTLLLCHTSPLVAQQISGSWDPSRQAAAGQTPGQSDGREAAPRELPSMSTDPSTGFRGHYACRTFSGLNRQLAIALSDRDSSVVAGLLRAGAEIDARSEGSHTRGMTILQMAIYHQWGIDSVRLAIEAGANVEARDARGNTALIYACQDSLGSNLDVVTELLRAGAKVDSQGARGMTPLMHAVMHDESLQVVEALLNASADVSARDVGGWTALMHATRRREDNVQVLDMLVAAGAGVNDRHKHGGTALLNAAYHGHAQMVRFLMAAGADVNSADQANWTPLLGAAMNGHAQIVRALLQSGANVHARDKLGRSALALARHNKHPAIVQLLTLAGGK